MQSSEEVQIACSTSCNARAEKLLVPRKLGFLRISCLLRKFFQGQGCCETYILQLAILPEMRDIKGADVYEYFYPLITKQIR